MEPSNKCSRYECKCSNDQFVWKGKRHKTCKACNNIEDLPEKNSTSAMTVAENSEPEQYFKVDYLDLGDLIEHKIQELTISAQIEEVADVTY
ncbi:hypothetical protein F8M41_011904 [Gigaspora margarita]|uniref:Uncharacterized protein n=1 Tax=Gigaspora margarita TaxID=4874 RepID=A0A8H4ATG1_GIGMA|nr:hypothetical protein F8M41_011904 [Gigaspora margarita]